MTPYVLATPVRNELEGLPSLFSSIESQQQRPALWLIVDDGSDDGSRQWLADKAATVDWMEVVDSPEEADEYLGGHIARVKAFGMRDALRRARERGLSVGYLGVLDADVDLPPEHYASLIRAFEADPKLGITSSVLRTLHEGEAEPREERFQRGDLPRGPTQFFRLACYEDIGGLPPWPGFDGAANAKAQQRGWRTVLQREVVAIHKRPTATRFGAAQGYERKGRYAWFLGAHPLIVAARALAYTTAEPRSGGYHFLRGWCKEALSRSPRCPDEEIRTAYGRKRVIRILNSMFGRGKA